MIGVGTFRTSARARKYVNQVLDAERLSYGPFIQKFEAEFASEHGCRFGIMTNSGTCCLMIALAALKTKYKWQDGDEVIVPAVTFIATSNIVLQLNMKPVFVDVEPDYFGLDPTKIEAAITERTRCIIPVHLFGLPCDMEGISKVAEKHNLRMIEDSCETMFANHKGRPVGSLSDIGCFSTYVAHILVTGVGGLCTTNDPELAVLMRSLMNHGRDNIYISIDDDKNKTGEEKKQIIARRFRFVQMGYSFRATELEGALGLAAFEERHEMMAKRRAHGRYLTDRLSVLSEHMQVPAIRPGCDHSYMMYPLVLWNEPKTRLVNYLEANGIETRDMCPLINQPFYQDMFGIKEGQYPVADWINNNGFYIACHQDLTQAELDYMVNTLKGFFDQRQAEPEKNTLIIMSKLPANDFDEVRVQNYFEALPVNEFDEVVLADGAQNNVLCNYFRNRNAKIIQTVGSKGQLLSAAVKQTRNENIVVMGMDGTDNPADIDNILIRLRNGADMVIASRFMLGGARALKGPMTHRSIGNRFFAFLVGLLFGNNISDTNNLFRGFKRSVYQKLKLDDASEEVMFEMTVRGIASGAKMDEFSTRERPVAFEIHKKNRLLSAFSFLGILGQVFLKRPTLDAQGAKIEALQGNR